MRIAFILDQFPTLSETFILNQITGLIDRGHEVDIFPRFHGKYSNVHEDVFKYRLLQKTFYSLSIPDNKFKRLLKGIYLFVSNFHRNPAVLIRSLDIFKHKKEAANLHLLYRAIPFVGKGPYDIIHAHYGPNGLWADKMRKIGAIQGKLLTIFHGYDIRLGIQNGPDFYAKLKEDGDLFLSISPYNKRHLLTFGFDPNKIVDHPVGIDTQRFSSHLESELYQNHDDHRTVRILTIARLVPEKGLEYGIRSIKGILRKNSSAQIQYTIVGDGEQKSQLEKLTRTLNLTGIVRFLGSLDQSGVRKALREADIFLLPSINEALPVCLMEAQATGLPVVASAVGSVDKLVNNGRSGFLVQAGDVDLLAEKLIYLIEHPEIWPEMGRAGRAYVEANYDIEKLNNRLVEIYRSLLDA
jgi:colanic acid/amylovoran biosynthesis glycosyltransferase